MAAKSGVTLVAEGYRSYADAMKNVGNLHKEAFSKTPLDRYTQALATNEKKMQEYIRVQQEANTKLATYGREVETVNSKLSQHGSVLSMTNRAIAQNSSKLDQSKVLIGKNAEAVKGLGTQLSGALGNIGAKAVSFLASKFAVLGAAIAAINLKRLIDEATQLAVRNETLAVTFDVVAKRQGYSAVQGKQAVDQLKKTGITTSQATQQLQRMAQAGLDWSKAAELARVAQDAAVISGTNSSQTFGMMTYAIQTGSSMILDNYGIMVRWKEGYEDMAKTLGKSADELTDQEKLQARMNQVLKQGEKIAGTYEAALDTAGKMQSSMARQIEETKVNIGNIFLPLETLKTKFEYDLWKGLQKATLGLSQFGNVVKILVDVFKTDLMPTFSIIGQGLAQLGKAFLAIQSYVNPLAGIFIRFWKSAAEGTDEAKDGFEKFGMTAMNAARMTAEALTKLGAWIQTFRDQANKVLVPFAEGLVSLFEGDFKGAIERFGASNAELWDTFGGEFREGYEKNVKEGLENLKEEFPDLYKSWKELTAVTNEGMEKITAGIDEEIAALEAQQKKIYEQQEAMRQAGKIIDDYNNSVKEAGRQFAEQMGNMEDAYTKTLSDMIIARDKALEKLNDDAIQKEQGIMEKARKKALDQEKKRNRQLEDERRKFHLSQLQKERRFKLQERKLMSEGDVLAIMDLREENELRKKEDQENFNENQRDRKQSAEEESRDRQEALNDQLKDLKKNIDDRRKEIEDQYKEQVSQQAELFNKQKSLAEGEYAKQLMRLEGARNEQLQALGKSFQTQVTLTEEGLKTQEGLTEDSMDKIGKSLSNLYGDQGIGQALIKGWADTSKNEMESAMEYVRAEFAATEEMLEQLQQKRAMMLQENAMPGSTRGQSTTPSSYRGPTGAGSAFNPTTQSTYSMPIANGTTSVVNVNVNGQVSGSGFGPATNQQATESLSTITNAVKDAVNKNMRTGVY